MSKKNAMLRLLTSMIAAVMLLSTVLTVTLSASGTTYYGSSPSISDTTGSVNLGTEQFYDQSVMQKLPDTVKADDDLSIIVMTKTETLLQAYDKSGSSLSFTDYSLTDEADAVRESINAEANSIQSALTGIDYELGESYNVVVSGFEIVIKAADFDKVCSAVSGKAGVIVGEVYNPAETQLVENKVNVYGTGIFDSESFQDQYGYDGTGMVVAVLDTGLDYYHSAFLDSNYTPTNGQLGLTFEQVSAIIANNDMAAEKKEAGLTAEDVYVSNKIPFGFDYADDDSDVFPLLSNHGTHVAGVIAGNRLDYIEADDYSGAFAGVAPGAQIAAMKIFSDVMDTARSAWIIAALEDCVTLGVDIINMSIGTSCGFSRESDQEAISGVYDRIRERGISMVVAASNSFNSAYSSDKNGNLPLTSNPDSGTVGSPSTYLGALCVASIEGAPTPYMTYNGSIIYFTESTDRFSESKDFVDEILASNGGGDTIEMEYVVVAGAGRTAADYTGIDVTGKIALIKRGYNTFEEKASLAEEMGAAGVIIYNNVSGDIRMNVGEVNIPVCSISQNNGEELAAAGSGKIVISRSQTSGPFISDFSSWGPTPDLQIKPEITAHGGSILSAVPGESYDRISGTSMATPNVSGVTALLRQYVINKFGYDADSDAIEITAMVNRLLMSTADITLGKNGLPYAVRKQGAGLANLTDSAATNAYIATYNDDGSIMDKSKIELGDDPDKTGVYTLNFGIVNFGSSALSYDLSAYVMTEGVSETKTAQGETTVTEESYLLDGAAVEIISVSGGTRNGNNITVNGGETANVSVRITLTEENKKYLNDSFENGMYVEGFIMLKNADSTQSLNLPYLAFFGDWTKAPLFDLDFYETNADELDDSIDPLDKTLPDAFATRPIGGSSQDYVSYLGSYYFEQDPQNKLIAADRKYISLSNQQSDNNEINSLRFIWAGLLRNAERVEVVITDDSTGEVVFSTTDYDVRKSYGDGGPIRPANIDIEFSAIEQNLKNNTKYTVTATAYLDYGDGGISTNERNVFSFPLVTDFSAPVLTGCEFYSEYDRSTKTNRLYARVAIYDNHYSMALLPGYIGLNDENQLDLNAFSQYATPIYSEYNSTSYVEIELTDYLDEIMNGAYNKNTFTVACYDYAMNSSTFEIALPDDFQAFGFTDADGGITKELYITLSPNEVYNLSPVVYPATEWGEMITYSKNNSKAVNVVNNQIVAVQPGGATVTARTPDGQTATIYVKVLSSNEEGYKEYSKPVANSFSLTGYYVNRAFYMLDTSERDIGVTGDERKVPIGTTVLGLSMYPSESITVRYDLLPYFPNSTYVEFSSGNDKVATVDQYGYITAVSEGSASITAKVMMDGKSTLYSATIMINVKEPYITSGPSLSHYFGAGDSSGHVIFPSTLAITEIGQFAFSNYDYVSKDPSEIEEGSTETMKAWFIGDSEVRSVVIPEGVTKIGAYAFAGITSLEEISLPSTLETIDYGAFYGCTNLKTVKGIENVKFINQSAFQGCSITGKVNLGNAVAIADFAFSENASIESVKISSSLQSFGAYAFGANSSLESVEIAAEKIKLGQYAFTDCTALKSITINTAVIPTGAFNQCTSLESVTIGKDVSVIEEYAFRNTRVKSFTLADGNTSFLSCDGGKYLTNAGGTEIALVAPILVSFSLDDSKVVSVGAGAFSGNASIESVRIPSVTSVGDYAFSECEKLGNVELGALKKIGAFAFENTSLESFEIDGNITVGEYAFSRSKLTSVEIGDGLSIPTGAFANCSNLKSVTIGKNVVIGDYAFYNDQYHTVGSVVQRPVYDAATETETMKDRIIYTIVFDGPITELSIGSNAIIGDSAFYGAASLESVSLGGGAYIGDKAFYNCASLENIDLSSVKEIGDYAFSGDIHYTYRDESYVEIDINEKGEYTLCYYTPKLQSVDLNSLEKLGEGAFAICSDLTSVSLGTSLASIPNSAFQNCGSLQSINLENVEHIGAYAFSECSLVNVDLSNATHIESYAFCYNDELTAVTLESENIVISEGAFSYCNALLSLDGEENASYIGDYAFAYTAFTEADLSNAEYIGSFAFYRDEKTAFDVTISEKVTDMGDNPFANCVIAPLSHTYTETFLDYFNEITTYTFDLNENIKIIDGSIYRVVPYGLELICWMGSDIAVVAENTVRISAMAFASLPVRQVVLPSQLKAIGHKAFYGCDSLSFISFSSYDAPILEEEYDPTYYESMEHIPCVGEYEFEDYIGKPFSFFGNGTIPFYMWNVTSMPTNYFYGANFVDYVGYVDENVAMIRPSNGKNYDSFIMQKYFSLTVDGATAADKTTLAAIEAIMQLPTNSKDITLATKPLVEAARAAYNKIMTEEQRALVSGDVLSILTNAEQRIADLEYLVNEGQAPVVTPAEAPDRTALIISIIIGVVFVLVVCAFVVVLIFFIRVVKMNPDLKIKPTPKEPEPLTPEQEKARLEEIARYVAAARPTPAPKTAKKEINRAPDIDKVIEERRSERKKVSLPVIISLIAAGVILVAGIIWIIVGGSSDFYKQFDKQGYTVNITFDANGGSFKGYDSSIIDLYNPDTVGENGIKILAPDDPARDKNNIMTISKAGHFLAGWYTSRTPIDPSNPDAGYTYSGKWDFENDRFMIDANKDYSAGESALTLYAAWVPYYCYEIYTVNEKGETVMISSVSDINLTIPEWHDGDVTLGMDNFPVREGYTLDGVYYDAAMTEKVKGVESGNKKIITGEWDQLTGTSLTPVIKLYTKWQEGERYRIYSTSDLIKNADADGYYEIYANLDFAGLEWPSAFENGKFTGKIIGNGHKISNVSIESTSRSRISNGLFSSIDSGASITNITFENITHTVNIMSVASGASFGLLTGTVADDATFRNVTLSGKILIGDDSAELAVDDPANAEYSIGLIAGIGSADGITSDITVEKVNPENTAFDIEIKNETVSLVKAKN